MHDRLFYDYAFVTPQLVHCCVRPGTHERKRFARASHLVKRLCECEYILPLAQCPDAQVRRRTVGRGKQREQLQIDAAANHRRCGRDGGHMPSEFFKKEPRDDNERRTRGDDPRTEARQPPSSEIPHIFAMTGDDDRCSPVNQSREDRPRPKEVPVDYVRLSPPRHPNGLEPYPEVEPHTDHLTLSAPGRRHAEIDMMSPDAQSIGDLLDESTGARAAFGWIHGRND